MTVDELIAEGMELARPSLLLSETLSESGVVAYYGGRGRFDHAGREDDQHRITIDCEWLSLHGIKLKGSLGIYEVDPHWRWNIPISLDKLTDAPLRDLDIRDGIPLYGHAAASIPPVEALCLYGGPAVDRWLTSIELQRTDYDQAAGSVLGEAYQEFYRRQCPLYDEGIVAVLGGWHAMWPDDDFYLPLEMRLALWVLRNAEPWIEVFERAPNLPIRLRST